MCSMRGSVLTLERTFEKRPCRFMMTWLKINRTSKMIIYEPDNSIKTGYRSIMLEIITEIVRNRWLTYQLFRRDFIAIYKQSFLGVVWTIIIPFLSAGIFFTLNRSGVIDVGEINVPYFLYAFIGMAFWQLFSMGLIASCDSLVKAGPMIVKINFSKKSLVIASAGQALVSFMFQCIFIGLLFVYYGITPHAVCLMVPLLLVPLVLLTLGLGFIFSLLNGIMRDVGSALSVVVTFLLFITPILYENPSGGALAELTQFNPLFYLVTVPRDILLVGAVTQWQEYWIATLFSTFIFIVGLVIFHLTEKRIAERI